MADIASMRSVFSQRGVVLGFLHIESSIESAHGGAHFSAWIWQSPLSMQAAGSCFIACPHQGAFLCARRGRTPGDESPPRELATANDVKRNCGRATDRGEEAWTINCEPINKNRIRGAAEQGERTRSRRALVAKATRCISGGCAVKACALTRGGLALCLKGRRANTEREGASNALVMIPPQHQMPAPAGQVAEQEDEALPDATSDETGLPRRGPEGAGRGQLEQAFARENMQRVWKAGKANKGGAGVDGLSIEDYEGDRSNNLYKLWNRLASGSYLPPPVKRVDIPKSDGKARPLGIFPLCRIVSPRWWSSRPWSRGWRNTSTRIPMGTGQTSPRIRHWHRPGSAASNMTGSSTSILRGSSTISTIRCC